MFFNSASPFYVHRDLTWLRSPFATARGYLGNVTHLTGKVAGHLVYRVGKSFQVPATPFTCAWPPSLPSVPTSSATRATSEEKVQLVNHRIDGILQLEDFPFYVHRDFFDRSPFATAVVTSAMLRT